MNISRSTNLMCVVSGDRYSILHKRTTDHLLVHIIILPVVGWCIVPLADRAVKRVLHIPVIEAGDEVGTADDVLRIKEMACVEVDFQRYMKNLIGD